MWKGKIGITMSILLVVDMQPRFDSSNREWLLKNVSREILRARRKEWGIIFLEYTRGKGDGGVRLPERTHEELTSLVGDYEDALIVHKMNDDGSEEVAEVICGWYGNYGKHAKGDMRVVGVNTGCCVANTVNGLAHLLPCMRITVVGDACNHESWYTSSQGKPSTAGYENIKTDRANVAIV
jgi:nicotinamidase-related amidase